MYVSCNSLKVYFWLFLILILC